MELVEQHRGDPLERGIIENLPREHTLGDDLDACALRDKALQAHAQADRLADFFAQARGHVGSGGAGGETARLEQQQTLAFGPRLIEQRERRARGLARAWGRDQDGVCVSTERGAQRRQRVVDRQRGVGVGLHRSHRGSRINAKRFGPLD